MTESSLPQYVHLTHVGHTYPDLAPIALFVYNRPDHTRKTVDSLRQNVLAGQSHLFIFSDAAKNESGNRSVGQVRKLIREIDGFRSVSIVERGKNFGLGNSVVAGVTQLCDAFGRAIVLEDDLLTTPDFLTFMNQGLRQYKENALTFSISGFNFALDIVDFPYDAFYSYRSSSLGWGTWKDRWAQVDWSVSDYHSFAASLEEQRKFQRAGEDLPRMLALQMAGKIDSWAIRWAYAHYKHDALALLSSRPRVFHIGDDGSGTHTRRGSLRQRPLTSEFRSQFQFPDQNHMSAHFVSELQRMTRPSIARKTFRYFRDRLRSNGTAR